MKISIIDAFLLIFWFSEQAICERKITRSEYVIDALARVQVYNSGS